MRALLKCFLSFCLVANAAAAAAAGERMDPPKNIILIGWDAAGRDHLKECLYRGELPNLQKLAAEGALVEIDILRMTVTKPGWTQILTGYRPEVTGVFSNLTYQPIPKGYSIFERLEQFFGPDNIVTAAVIGKKEHMDADPPRKVPVDKGQAKKHLLKDEEGEFIAENGAWYHLFPGKPFLYTSQNMDVFINGLLLDEIVAMKTMELLQKYRDRRFFFFVHFAEIDQQGHLHNENSREYNDAYVSADFWTGRIIRKLKELGLYDRTLVYVTSDHGFNEGDWKHPDAPCVFLATNDPKVIRGGERADIAPTILTRFGMDPGKIDPPLDGYSLTEPYRPAVWKSADKELMEKLDLFSARLLPLGLRVERGGVRVPERFEMALSNPFAKNLSGTFYWLLPKKSPWRLPEGKVEISLAPGEERKISVPTPPGATLADLKTFRWPPVAVWDLYLDGSPLPLWKNRRTEVLVDRWPYRETRDVLTRAAEMETAEKIIVVPGGTGVVAIPWKNPGEGKLRAVMSWRFPPGCRWKISPEAQTVELSPREAKEIKFNFSFAGSMEEAFPLPRMNSIVVLDGEEVLNASSPLPIDVVDYLTKETRVAHCRRTETAPQLDGKLDDPAWRDGVVASDFYLPKPDHPAKYPTEVRFVYDRDNLYVSFRCFEPDPAGLLIDFGKRDDPVWKDDVAELFLDTGFDRKNFYQFSVNPAGVVLDARQTGTVFRESWNGDWQVKTGREPDAWTVEMALPWKMMDMNAPVTGAKMGLELVRRRAQSPYERSQWAPTFGDNEEPERYGVLIIE